IAAGMLKFPWMAVVVMTMSSALIGIGATNLLRQPPPAPAPAPTTLTREPIAEGIGAGGTWQEGEGATYCTPPKATTPSVSPLDYAIMLSARCTSRGGHWASDPTQPGEGVCVFLDGGDLSG